MERAAHTLISQHQPNSLVCVLGYKLATDSTSILFMCDDKESGHKGRCHHPWWCKANKPHFWLSVSMPTSFTWMPPCPWQPHGCDNNKHGSITQREGCHGCMSWGDAYGVHVAITEPTDSQVYLKNLQKLIQREDNHPQNISWAGGPTDRRTDGPTDRQFHERDGPTDRQTQCMWIVEKARNNSAGEPLQEVWDPWFGGGRDPHCIVTFSGLAVGGKKTVGRTDKTPLPPGGPQGGCSGDSKHGLQARFFSYRAFHG